MPKKVNISLSTIPPTEIELISTTFYCPRCGEDDTWFTEWGDEDNAGFPIICRSCSYVFREQTYFPVGAGYTPDRHQEIYIKLKEATKS